MLLLSACRQGQVVTSPTENSLPVPETSLPLPTNTEVSSPATAIAPTLAATTQPEASPAGSGWVELASMKVARSEMPAAYLDGKIYTFGGLVAAEGISGVDTVEVYDIETDQWAYLAPLPQARHHGMVAVYADKIYHFGGAPATSLAGTNDAWVYDPAADAWTTLSPMPHNRSAGAAVVLDEKIYIVAGVGGESGELMRYDPATDTYELLTGPNRREHTAAVALDGKIYLIGGRWRDNLNTVEVYDPLTDSWQDGPAMLQPRAGHGAGVVAGKIYALGGELLVGGGGVTLNTMEVFDLTVGAWQESIHLPIRLHGVPAVTDGERLYVVGGSRMAGAAVNAGQVFMIQP